MTEPMSSSSAVAATAPEPTGNRRIDESLERLEVLDDLDLALHPDEFDAIHGVLRESLANAGRDEIVLDSP